MVKKVCSRCKSYSYSSSTSGEWICPACGFDISAQPFELLGLSDCQRSAPPEDISVVEGKKEKFCFKL